MFGSKKPKREFRPRSHAAIYVVAMIYLGFLIYDFVGRYRAGGPDAPSAGMLAAGVAALGVGMILLGILAWRMYNMPVPENEDTEDPDEFEDGEDWEPDELDEPDGPDESDGPEDSDPEEGE